MRKIVKTIAAGKGSILSRALSGNHGGGTPRNGDVGSLSFGNSPRAPQSPNGKRPVYDAIQENDTDPPADHVHAHDVDLTAVMANSGNFSKLSQLVEQTVCPQMAVLENRIERIVKDLTDIKRTLESQLDKKADKQECQAILYRMAPFEAFEPKKHESRINRLDTDIQTVKQAVDEVSAQIRTVETAAATRVDVGKTRSEMAKLSIDSKKWNVDLKEFSASTYQAHQRLTQMITEVKERTQKEFVYLEQEKASSNDAISLAERVQKLEYSMKDTRHILSDPGGSDISPVVKRIILNMEDKIMVLDKKLDAVNTVVFRYDGGGTEGSSPKALAILDKDPSDSPGTATDGMDLSAAAPGRATDTSVRDKVSHLNSELVSMHETVTKLRQELHVSQAHMDHIHEQGKSFVDMASKLNVVVDGAVATVGGESEGTVLSLNRVQVMIAAASRQLIAGSKWVTRETFDQRVTELRKEYVNGSRKMQADIDAQLEEVGNLLMKPVPHVAAEGQSSTKLPRMLAGVGRNAADQPSEANFGSPGFRGGMGVTDPGKPSPRRDYGFANRIATAPAPAPHSTLSHRMQTQVLSSPSRSPRRPFASAAASAAGAQAAVGGIGAGVGYTDLTSVRKQGA